MTIRTGSVLSLMAVLAFSVVAPVPVVRAQSWGRAGTSIEIGSNSPAGDSKPAQRRIPVLILRDAAGVREVLPLEQGSPSGDDLSAVEYPIDLGAVGASRISLSLVGGAEMGSIEGLAASLGMFIGEQGDGMLGHVRSGLLIEINPGLGGTKVGVGWTIGSSQLFGVNANFTYLRTYGSSSIVPAGEDLVGVELGGELMIAHWFVGVLESLQSGTAYINAGAGIRFY